MKDFIKSYVLQMDLMKTLVGLTVLFVFSIMVLKLIHEEIPANNREIIVHIIGMVEGALSILVSFYFGSSKGSQNKDKMLAESLPGDKPKP
jgi:hypothetical protein